MRAFVDHVEGAGRYALGELTLTEIVSLDRELRAERVRLSVAGLGDGWCRHGTYCGVEIEPERSDVGEPDDASATAGEGIAIFRIKGELS